MYLEYGKTAMKKEIAMLERKTAQRLLARHERLKASVAALGLVQIGSVTERIDRRPDARGRARARARTVLPVDIQGRGENPNGQSDAPTRLRYGARQSATTEGWRRSLSR